MKNNILSLIIFILLISCKDNNKESFPILCKWSVLTIIENGSTVQKDFSNDSIVIEFLEDGTIYGNSSRNLLTGQYRLYKNDSIWISYIGGTEKAETNWGMKFSEIMPKIKFYEFKNADILILYTANKESHIEFNKRK